MYDFYDVFEEYYQNKSMGTQLCKQQRSQNSVQRQKSEKSSNPAILEEIVDIGNTDATQIDDEPSPLKKFIANHSSEFIKGASNGLCFQSTCTSDGPKGVKIESVKMVKPRGSIAVPRVGRAKPRCSIGNNIPRLSIEPQNVAQFQQTLKDYVMTQKRLGESFGRIEISNQKFIHLRKEDLKKYYEFGQKIGEGAYGSVYKVYCKNSRQKRAVKIIKKQNLRNKKHEVFAQLQLLRKMDHPNIIKLYEVFEWQHRYQVVMEYCDGGSIIDFIKSRHIYDEEIVKTIMKQLLGCLNYLNKIKIVHRDLKLENVVFNSAVQDFMDKDQIQIKLLDFGTACKINKPRVKCPDLVGTVSYMAPEIVRGFFTDKCDLWSCGVIFYILLASKAPFRCAKKQHTLQKILTHQIKFTDEHWKKVGEKAKDLLKKLLEKDPNKRLSAADALNHPWFERSSHEGVHLASSNFLTELSNYYRQNNLISVLESYLVFTRISQKERKSINDIFKALDQNLDGFIEKRELIEAFKEKDEFNIEDVEFILSKIDKDQSGKISLNQFTTAMVDKSKLWAQEALEDAFDYFDTNKTGFIQKNQLESLLSGSNSDQIEELLEELDLNKDRKISKEEFIDYLLRQGCLH